MQPDILWAFVIIFTLDSITPGPATTMVMSRGASVGLSRTLPFIAGLVVGDLILFLGALLGLAALAHTYAPVFFVVKWLGVCYLLYLAYSTWTAKPDIKKIKPLPSLCYFLSATRRRLVSMWPCCPLLWT